MSFEVPHDRRLSSKLDVLVPTYLKQQHAGTVWNAILDTFKVEDYCMLAQFLENLVRYA
jgi:hypothetical protein